MEDKPETTPEHENTDTAPVSAAEPKLRSGFPILLRALVAALAVLTAVSGFLGWRWYTAERDLTALRQNTADRDQAAAIATDYAKRSLTYDFRNLGAFFDGVRNGTTDNLSHRYDTVRDTLTKIMTEAQVVAHGDVLGTAIASADGNNYTVTVFATQQTQNVQHPEPVSASTLLTVTVQHNGGQWLVADYHSR